MLTIQSENDLDPKTSKRESLYVFGSTVPDDDFREYGNPSGEYTAEYTPEGVRTGSWVNTGWRGMV
jgi:hypothetical protein